MRVRPSDLYVRQENSSFAIYVDPFGSEYFFDKKLKLLNKYPAEIGDRPSPCESKTQAKKLIIEMVGS